MWYNNNNNNIGKPLFEKLVSTFFKCIIKIIYVKITNNMIIIWSKYLEIVNVI